MIVCVYVCVCVCACACVCVYVRVCMLVASFFCCWLTDRQTDTHCTCSIALFMLYK